MSGARTQEDGAPRQKRGVLRQESGVPRRKGTGAPEGHKIVLASASPRRRELLLQAGIRAEVIPSHKEEKSAAKTPAGLVKALSRTKARDIASGQAPGVVVIGADTVVVRDGEILGKPRDAEDAVRTLRSLSGRTHQVYTGVTMILCGAREVTFAVRTDVSVYPLTEEEIRAYVESGDPMDKAGSYGIQGPFGAYIRGIRGEYTNVVGLPLGRTVQELKKLLAEDGY